MKFCKSFYFSTKSSSYFKFTKDDPILEKHFQAHATSISSLSFNHTGRQLTSGSKDGILKVWNFKPQVNSFIFKDKHGPINCVSFSPCGKLLASAAGSTVCLRTPERKSEFSTFRAHLSTVRFLDFSYDSANLATCSDDKNIKLWNVKGVHQKFDYSLVGHSNWVRCVKFSPDGKLVASCADDNTVKFWDLSSRNCVRTCYGHSSKVNSVDFHPNGFCLASSSNDESVRIWDIRMKRTLQVHEGCSGKVLSVNFHHYGQYLACAYFDGTLKIYDILDGRLVYTLHGHQGSVNSVQFTKQGDYLCSADSSGKIFVWRTNFENSVSNVGLQPPLLSPADRFRSPSMDDYHDGNNFQRSPIDRHPRSRSVESALAKVNEERHQSSSYQHKQYSPVLGVNRTSPLLGDGNFVYKDVYKDSSKLANTLENIVQQLGLLAETVSLLEKRLNRMEKKVQDINLRLDSRNM